MSVEYARTLSRASPSLRLAYENDVIAGLGCLLTELIVQFLLLCAKFDHAGGHENAARIEQSEDVESRTAAARV